MAQLSKEDILKLAQLARLRLSDEEVVQYQSELAHILEYVEVLNNIDLHNYEPTAQVNGLKNVTRKDELLMQAAAEDLLSNAPATQDGYVKVQRMVE